MSANRFHVVEPGLPLGVLLPQPVHRTIYPRGMAHGTGDTGRGIGRDIVLLPRVQAIINPI